MTDRQFLGVKHNAEGREISLALKEKISDLDFEIDIELILTYIQCAERLMQQLKHGNNQEMITVDELEDDTATYLVKEEIYDTPEKLISYFETLYENTDTRFNKLCWKSAIDQTVKNSSDQLHLFCEPIADFLTKHPFIKSETIQLIANAFPFINFFPKNDPENEENQIFWKKYGYLYNLLRRGNLELDLHASAINTGRYTSVQLDDMFNRLAHSAYCYRQEQYSQAYNILSEIPPEVKPLLIWQRELSIVYKVHVQKKDENLKSVFISTINNALSYFPDDAHLLYMRCKYLFYTSSPETCKDEIIATLKRIPTHHDCMFLLGKCYMQLGLSRAALIIFEKLKKLNPLNMEYVTAAALASRKYIDFCIKEYDPNDNDKAYYLKMISELTKLNMFDEIEVFATQAPKEDKDINASILFAKAVETYVFQGKKDKQLLLEALSITNDKKITQNIKEYYLRDLPNWDDIKAEKDFIVDFYNEYPDDSMANYQMGMYYHAIADYENAYIYFLRAKEIDPENTEIYYNLSRTTVMTERYEEAIEYIKTFLLYKKYNLNANAFYCEWTYWIKDYYNAHMGAKWLLSLCNKNEFIPKYFFHFTAGLSLYLNTVEPERHNHAYIKDMLDLYDEYPKPATFWTDDYGSKSMYWAAKLSFNIKDHERCIEYLQCILKNVKEYNWSLMESCLYDLLPSSMQALEQYEEIIQALEPATVDLLTKESYNPEAALPSFYLANAYGKLDKLDEKLHWVLNCAYCYQKSDNPPIDWLENYLINNFDTCLDNELYNHIILIGQAYLKIITPINANFIYVTHYIANILCAYENLEEGLSYHRSCVEYGAMFPDEYNEQSSESQQFIDNHSTSDILK